MLARFLTCGYQIQQNAYVLCSAAVCRINHALLDYHFDRTGAAIFPELILFMCCALVLRIKFSSVLPVQGKRDGGGCVATSKSGYLWLSREAAPWRPPWLRRLPPPRDDNCFAATFLGSGESLVFSLPPCGH